MALVACLLVANAIGQTTGTETDKQEIRELVARYVTARNSHDAAATRRLFTSDADQLVSSGEWRKGADDLVRGAMAASQKEAAKSTITVESIRFITPVVALVDGRYETVSVSTGVTRKMWTALLVAKVGQDWRISAIRNMLPASNAH
jgi:uncharacterized protein (TIGR02246 family)